MSEQAAEQDKAKQWGRVIVARRVVEKMVRGALRYPDIETGEALVGLVIPQQGRPEPQIYVLDTIPPGPAAVREWGMFAQGGDWQGDVLHWLHVNWEAMRAQRRGSYGSALAAKWDAPLQHVGDWHKQPGDMIAPSSGDARTARSLIADPEAHVDRLIAPIVTLYRLPTAPTASEDAEEGNADVPTPAPLPPDMPALAPNALVELRPEAGWAARIDFWYMSARTKRFTPIVPVVWDNERLPSLPPIAWHLARPERFEREYALLTEAGFQVDAVRWDADGRPPLEICFALYRPGSTGVVLLITSADYPARMPAVRLAPLVRVAEGEDMFEKLYAASRSLLPTELPTWPWEAKRTLVELALHAEKVFAKQAGRTTRKSAEGNAP